MLSNACKYAIRGVLFLGLNEEGAKIRVNEIAENIGVPSPFLSKIFQKLAKQNLISSTHILFNGCYYKYLNW